MSFNDRSEFIQAQASEKLTLAHVHATTRLVNWTVFSGSVYCKTIPYFGVELKQKLSSLTQVSSFGSLSEGTWLYEPDTSNIYVWTNGSLDPDTLEMVVTYRFFFANGPCTLSWDLTDSGDHVFYNGLIKDAPKFKHKVGVDQKLVSVIGQGDLKLQNNDGGLDEVYDTLFFENQIVNVYSWNRTLPFSESKIIYRGRVTNKRYNSTEVVFKIKDLLFDLLQNVPQIPYDDSDNVTDSVKGTYKRWVYGRVDGLHVQSLDQIGEGYDITGTVSIGGGTSTLLGVGTQYLSEVSPGDVITVGTQEFDVSFVGSDTNLILEESAAFGFSAQTASIVPVIPTTSKNREFFVAGHATSRLTTQVVSISQLNRIVVADTTGFSTGDFVEFNTGERIEIKKIATGNVLQLRQNVIVKPTVGTDVTRQPIQDVYIKSELVASDKYTISNTGGSTKETTITLDSDVEFQIASTQSIGFNGTFTNGSSVVSTTDDVILSDILKPRDFILPTDIAYTTFYEVLDVTDNLVYLRTVFNEATHSGPVEGKKPDYIGDETIVSVNLFGKTKDGEPDGDIIRTSSDATRDLLNEVNVTNINEASFTEVNTQNNALVSMAIPLIKSGAQVSAKNIIDKLSQSTTSALTLDNNLNLQYTNLLPRMPENPTLIQDKDIKEWAIQSVNGDLIRNTLIRYRHKDIDRYTQEQGNLAVSYSSDFVETYIGTNTSSELDVYLYEDTAALIMSHREIYFRSLARAEIRILSDLRFENLEIGDSVIIDLNRLYKRFGDKTSSKKVGIVVGKTVSGSEVEFFLSDLANIPNRSSIITPNDAPSYSAATEDEKLKYGYITDSRGLVDDDEDTQNIHLIS